MNPRKSAFTLIELLVVVAIIAILAAISVPVIGTAIENAKKAQARTEIKTIETALRAYFNEYSKFPHGNGQPDRVYAGDNNELFNVLRNLNAEGNSNYEKNPRRIVFLEVPANSLITLEDKKDRGQTGNLGLFVDPWPDKENQRVPYRIALDTDFDNIVRTGLSGDDGRLENKTIAVWSLGPGGENSSVDDYIKSWR